MSTPEGSLSRRLDIAQVDPVAEASLTAVFQELHIGRAGEPMMSDPRRVVTPREVIRQRRIAKDSLSNVSDEEILLQVLQERPEHLSAVDFANVVAGWALVYGWNSPQQG